MCDTDALLRSALASFHEGVRVFRLEGLETIRVVKRETNALVIGLLKRKYPGSDVYITPTAIEVKELLDSSCDIIALDATLRRRPTGETFADLAALVHYGGKTVMADCDTVESAIAAAEAGADIVSSTLSGYTTESPSGSGPDLEFIREVSRVIQKRRTPLALQGEELTENNRRRPLIFAEGRFLEKWQVEAALQCGADAVVVGGAINDPLKNTRRLLPNQRPKEQIGVIDIGGTWLRVGVAGAAASHADDKGIGPIRLLLKEPLPPTRRARMDLLGNVIKEQRFSRIGVSSAGVIWQNRVTLSKKFIPENQGTDYNELRPFLRGDDPIGVIALGDGHAAAWAHANHPDFAGKDIVVLAIGTGLGFGHVRQGKIVMGREGEYSRLNDLPGPGTKTFEQMLGGAVLTPNPTEEQVHQANAAVQHAIRIVSTFLFPDVVVVCGTVGMQPWLDLNLPHLDGWPDVPVVRSPFRADAGLHGAAALALYPPL